MAISTMGQVNLRHRNCHINLNIESLTYRITTEAPWAGRIPVRISGRFFFSTPVICAPEVVVAVYSTVTSKKSDVCQIPMVELLPGLVLNMLSKDRMKEMTARM